MPNVLVNDDSLKAIGNAIREKNGETTTYKPAEMAAAITAISGGGSSGYVPTDDDLTYTGDTTYLFSKNKYNWIIEHYADRIKTQDLTSISYMFYYSIYLRNIPFNLNLKRYTSNATIRLSNIFQYCGITTAPKIISPENNYIQIESMQQIFEDCSLLENIDDNYFDFIDNFSGSQPIYSYCSLNSNFRNCSNLKNYPSSYNKIINKASNLSSTYNGPYYYTFFKCYKLPKIENLALLNKVMTSDNLFNNTFVQMYSLKKLTFTPNEIRSWKGQVIDLSSNVGYGQLNWYVDKYPHHVTNDEEYQNYKQYDDWWSSDIAYACYNRTSAVETINSLPDTSAYLAEKGGTNTIKFKGAAGSATDGGAINTMTEEEIAVATAKGWTVSFV